MRDLLLEKTLKAHKRMKRDYKLSVVKPDGQQPRQEQAMEVDLNGERMDLYQGMQLRIAQVGANE